MRIALAVIAGFLTTVVLAFGTDFLLRSIMGSRVESESLNLLIATLAYTELYAVAGGYVAGRIAGARFMLAAVILAGVAWALTLTTLVPATSVPLWYKVVALVLLIPCTLAGGYLSKGRSTR